MRVVRMIGWTILIVYAVVNICCSLTITAREMKNSFINGQDFISMAFVNIFYAPAWVLKGIKYIIEMAVR